MSNFITEKCDLIIEGINSIEIYREGIKRPADFESSELNKMKFDAIMMRLQAIGENIKKISKIDETFFPEKLSYDTNIVIRFRDFISHHYEKLDTEIVFDICENDIPSLKKKLIDFKET
jgi:uncharacterized protein with HEPN domain